MLTEQIVYIINSVKEPLETKEIQEKLAYVSRTKIIYRLNDLRGQGKIKGKLVSGGKGTWIWWSIK